MEDELIETFLMESRDNLQTLEEGLLDLESSPKDKEIMDVVFRAIHTIKGGAGLVGLKEISDLTHHLENILDFYRQSGEAITTQFFTLLFSGIDLINKMIEGNDLTGASLQGEIDEIMESLQDYSLEKVEKEPEVEVKAKKKENLHFYKLVLRFRPDIFETGTDPLMLLLELEGKGNILESYLNFSQVPRLEDLTPHTFHLYWTIFLETSKNRQEIEDVFIFVMDENDITIQEITHEMELWFDGEKKMGEILVERGLISEEEIKEVLEKQKRIGELLVEEKKITRGQMEKVATDQEKMREKQQSSTIRVDTQKLETILNYIAELIISHSRTKELVSQIPGIKPATRAEIFNSYEELNKTIRFIQEEVMKASMIPIGGTFIRFQRMVRDMANDMKKDVDLVVKGKETELDKRVIEEIADPLKHLIRNSMDHGMETPQERLALGKSSQGIIELNAFHQEGNIYIEIRDDGRGINEDAVLSKAKKQGLISAEDKMSSHEIHQLLFRPGFTTSEKVTDISGRGVGLDVVMTNIKNLRGTIELYSKKNEGTRFRIKLPLTQAIIDGIILRVGNENFIIPITAIIEFIKCDPVNVKKVEGKGYLIRLREEMIPYTTLHQLLHMEKELKPPTEGLVVFIKDDQRKMALLVDEIVGQDQVVIKSMSKNLEQIDGIAGATIMGNGKVALILDPPSLFRLARHTRQNGQLERIL